MLGTRLWRQHDDETAPTGGRRTDARLRGGPVSGPMSHTRVPKQARDLCASAVEAACVFLLWDRADEARWEPFRLSQADFRQGVLGGTPAARLWADLVDAGLLRVVEPGRGRRPALVAVVNPTTGECVVTPKARKGHNRDATGPKEGGNGVADHDALDSETGPPANTTGSQQGRNRDGSGAPNARAEINLQPPASSLQGEHKAEQQPLPGAGAEPAAAAPESGKPDDVSRIWDEWEPVRVEVYGGRAGKLTASRKRAMRARLREHGADEVEAVIRWWLRSGHERARYLRDQRFTWDTVLRPSNFPSYRDIALAIGGKPSDSASPPAAAETAWSNLLSNVRDHGRAALTNAPPEILAALNRAGGYRQLANITSDYERARFRERFLSAYREAA